MFMFYVSICVCTVCILIYGAGNVGGSVIQYKGISFLTIKGAGHMVYVLALFVRCYRCLCMCLCRTCLCLCMSVCMLNTHRRLPPRPYYAPDLAYAFYSRWLQQQPY